MYTFKSAEIDQAATAVNQMTAAVEEVASNAVSLPGCRQDHHDGRDQVRKALAALRQLVFAGDALEVIAQAIAAINERNLVIASASEEQAQVAREVDRNLVNIRDLATQTSAGAHQTSAAAQDLSRLALSLNGMVARFRL